MELTTSETAHVINEAVDVLANISDACDYLSSTEYVGCNEAKQIAGLSGFLGVISYAAITAFEKLRDYRDSSSEN